MSVCYEDFCWNPNLEVSKPSKMDRTFLQSDYKSEVVGKQDNIVCFVCVVVLNYISNNCSIHLKHTFQKLEESKYLALR